MLGILIALASACMVQGNGLAPVTNCKESNYEADRMLAKSNLQMKKEGQDRLLVDWYGFEREVSVYAFGWKLPISVALKVSNGTLTGMNTLKRSNDAFDCTTGKSRTLKGYFEYGPELALSYNVAEAKLLHHKIQGKFTFIPKLKMYVELSNETGDCHLETVKEAKPEARSGQSEYIFETGRCWMSRLVSKLLVWGLQGNDQTPMKAQVCLWSQGEVFKYLTDAWCQSK